MRKGKKKKEKKTTNSKQPELVILKNLKIPVLLPFWSARKNAGNKGEVFSKFWLGAFLVQEQAALFLFFIFLTTVNSVIF